MSLRAPLAAAILVAVVLAGCAGEPKAGPASASAVEGDGARVSGQVLDPETLPIIGATVSLHDTKNFELRQNATTDADGNFDFGKVPAGNWLLAVSAAGYEDERRNVSVIAGLDQTVK